MPAVVEPPTKLLTPEQVADLLGVELSTLAAWRTTKRYALAWIRVGRLIRYRVADVEEFLTERTENGPEKAV